MPADERDARWRRSGTGFFRVVLRYGFMEDPDVPAALAHGASTRGSTSRPWSTTYFLGRETLIATRRRRAWRSGASSSSP